MKDQWSGKILSRKPLPQLPLKVDAQGFLRSQAGYDQPVGPGFWERP